MKIEFEVDKKMVIHKMAKAASISKKEYSCCINDDDGKPLYLLIGDDTSIVLFDFMRDIAYCKIKWVHKRPPSIAFFEVLISAWLTDLPNKKVIINTPDSDYYVPDGVDWR